MKKTRRQYPVLCCPGRPHSALGLCHPCWQFYRKNGPKSERGLRLSKIVAGHEERKRQVAAQWDKEKKLRRSIDPARRDRTLRSRYNLSAAEYNNMLTKQNGRCAICECEPLPNRPLCVDHHHATSKVRSLLCDGCNIVVGILEKKPHILVVAQQYITSHSIEDING